jgi:ATP-binding cassette subfamily C exporter for protease/lipase
MKAKRQQTELNQWLWTQSHALRWAAVFSVLVGVMALTPTVYMLQVYGRVVNSRSLETLMMLTWVTLGAFVIMEWLSALRTRLMWTLGLRLDMALSSRVYEAMMGVLATAPQASARSALDDQKSVREFFHNPAIAAFMELPVALIALVLLYWISPWLALAAGVGALLQTAVAWALQLSTRQALDDAQQQAQAAQAFAEASLRNAQVMESMGMLGAVMGHWKQRQNKFLLTQVGASEAASGLNAATKLLQQMMGSVLLGLSAWLLLHQDLNGGAEMLIVSSILGGRLLSPLTQMISQWRAWVQFIAAWKRLTVLLNAVPPAPKQMRLPAPQGDVHVEALAGGAPGDAKSLIKGVQFALRPGQMLGVVGPSGAGKSTLARLLLGVWTPTQGKVRLGGVDVHQWDKRELGPHVGYLPQSVELMDGTIADNICRFSEPDPEQLEAAVRLVGLSSLVDDLPQGLDTPVGRDGVLLSGGQRQRIALARALYGRPAFVVLDEPNSSLDEAGDRALMQAIQIMRQAGTTFVVMSHRMGLLEAADGLLVLRDGMQYALGPRAEVLQKLQQAATRRQVPETSQPIVAPQVAT